MADDLTDLFVDALQHMRTPSYAQERRTRVPIIYEKNYLTKRDVPQGVNPKDVIAFQDSDQAVYPRIVRSAYGGVTLPPGVISVDPHRMAENVASRDYDGGPQTPSRLVRHEAIHQALNTARGGKGIDLPSEKDVPSLGKVKQLLTNAGVNDIGDPDLEIPSYVSQQPWRVPGLTPDLRTKFIDEYSNYVEKQDPVAAKEYRFLSPADMPAQPEVATTAPTPAQAVILNNEQ